MAKAVIRKPKKKVCQFCKEKATGVDYKDTTLLRKFISDRGKIRARRVTGNCVHHQRDVATAVKNARELALLPNVRVVLCLGQFAWTAALTTPAIYGGPPPRPRPAFGHGAVHAQKVSDTFCAPVLLGCFHVSQQNTFTGKLTPEMIDTVLRRAAEL